MKDHVSFKVEVLKNVIEDTVYEHPNYPDIIDADSNVGTKVKNFQIDVRMNNVF